MAPGLKPVCLWQSEKPPAHLVAAKQSAPAAVPLEDEVLADKNPPDDEDFSESNSYSLKKKKKIIDFNFSKIFLRKTDSYNFKNF